MIEVVSYDKSGETSVDVLNFFQQEMEKSLKQMKDKYGKQIKEMMRQHSQELQQVGLIRKNFLLNLFNRKFLWSVISSVR